MVSYSQVIDISVPLRQGMPTWPGEGPFGISTVKSLARGDNSTVSYLSCGLHTGTHVDAPSHFLASGAHTDSLPLDVLMGSAYVIYLPWAAAITADELKALSIPSGTSRLLLRTRNSDLWAGSTPEFHHDFVALTPDAARWVVEKRIRLIGVDYLSVARFGEGGPTHRILLEGAVVIVEGLNLSGVPAGPWDLICLPLKLVGTEAALARAILLR